MSRAGRDADAGRLADEIIAMLREIDIALCPVIGRRGFDALQARCLYLASSSHAWLNVGLKARLKADEAGPNPLDLATLRSILSRQSPDLCTAGGVALLTTFGELLTSLIGRSLTDRLLSGINAKGTL